MLEKTIYICEKCGKEFNNYHEAENHEWKCLDKKKLFEDNIKGAIMKIKQEFSSFILDSTYEIEDNCFVSEGDFHFSYHFNITFKLANGNTVEIYDGMDDDLWLGNYLEEDKIYNSSKREIEKSIPTSFEGVITWKYKDDSWRTDYLGDLEISDIVDRLNGRKVKIEVIE